MLLGHALIAVARGALTQTESPKSQNIKESRGQTLPMSDGNNGLEKKHEILLQKYKTLRRNHRKLAGIALRLIEALETFLKDDGKPDIRSMLLSCLTMYPGLVENSIGDERSTGRSEPPAESAQVGDEPEKNLVDEDGQEEVKESESSEKEYFKGFWSKPKIPRTPLV